MDVKKEDVGVNYGKLTIHDSIQVTVVVAKDSWDKLVAGGTLMHETPKPNFSVADISVLESIANKVKMEGMSSDDVTVIGIGGMGSKVIREFMNREIGIRCIMDKTPIPHNGCCPAKVQNQNKRMWGASEN